ncbi:MAG: hypothetical protein QOD75_3641 [Blastocatellia bacterium]|jgi:hypothetical protein|nr:hypothetical protein [Blastocatellia bacterium]
MLIDYFMPLSDAAELHRIEIAAPREVVYEALWTTDLGGSPIIKSLLGLRSLPALVLHPAECRPVHRKITLHTIIGSGFGKLAGNRDREIVLGVAGRFWRPVGNLLPFKEENFQGPVPAGTARAVWNFALSDVGNERTLLSTETRILCGDPSSRRKFRAYWLLVRPFSGLIRILMLRAIKRASEHAGQ